MKSISNINEDETYIILTCFVMFSEIGKDLWDDNDKLYAYQYYTKNYKNITLEQVAEKYSETQLQSTINQILKARMFEIETMVKMGEEENKETCNSCKLRKGNYSFLFYLTKEIEKKRDWTKTIVSIGISAITIPLLGRGIFSFPGSEKKYKVFSFNYKLCNKCKMDHTSIMGKIKVSKDELSNHPSVIEGKKIGYSIIKYVNEIS